MQTVMPRISVSNNIIFHNDKIIEMKANKFVGINEDEIDEFQNVEEPGETKINRKSQNFIKIKDIKLLRSTRISTMRLNTKNRSN